LEYKKISVVTISFNQGKYLLRTMNSIIDQKYPNLEYIIVDPGSSDNSRDIILEHKNYFDKIIFEKDSGPADGLNKGFSFATGDIFGYLNSDDILYPNVLEKINLNFCKNNNIDVLSAHGYYIDESDLKIKKIFSNRFNLKQYLYENCVIIQQSTFFSSKIFNKSKGFNVKNNIAWDGELMVDFGRKNANFIVRNEFWSGFRIYSESISGKEDYKKKLAFDYERLRKISNVRKPHILKKLLHKIIFYISQPDILLLKLKSKIKL
tara:strand:+ start:11493 stop:12284 length:792 start_codon:yes stop_codon:yes gene_type:complete